MSDIIGYGLYGDEVGFYADKQPNYEYSFTKELDNAKIWKTFSFDNELIFTNQKYDPSVRIIKIKRETIITCDNTMTFDHELEEWDTLLQQFNADAEGMSDKDYNRFRKLKSFVHHFGGIK